MKLSHAAKKQQSKNVLHMQLFKQHSGNITQT